MKIAAFIPAKGTSSRLPNKNTLAVGGLTLVERAMQLAKHVGIGYSRYVCTDSDAVRSLATLSGAKLLSHPEGDHSMEVLISRTMPLDDYDVVCLIQPSSVALTKPGRLRDAINAVCSGDFESAAVVSSDHGGAFTHEASGFPPMLDWGATGESGRKDTRTLSNLVIDRGGPYVFQVDAFIKEGNRMCGNTAAIIAPKRECIDIDTYDDLLMARALYEYEEKNS